MTPSGTRENVTVSADHFSGKAKMSSLTVKKPLEDQGRLAHASVGKVPYPDYVFWVLWSNSLNSRCKNSV